MAGSSPSWLLDGLDPDQVRAVTVEAAPLRILAGPGSGKTRVLTRRIAWRVHQGEVDPRHVLALTFTRKAATELRQRLTGIEIRDLGPVGTFHGVAYAQLRQRALDRGHNPPVVGDAARLLADAAKRTHVDTRVLRRELGWLRRRGEAPTDYEALARSAGRRPAAGIDVVAEALRQFELAKRRAGLLDLDDLLTECTRLLRSEPGFAEIQRWRFRHVFVDEFQDVNAPQFALLRAWLGDRVDLCVVGDPDQAVYGWNGADSDYLEGFDRWWPLAATVTLGHNHRNPPSVAAAAGAALGRLSPPTGELAGAPATLAEFDDPGAEALGVARRLAELRDPGEPWSHLAVLARTNAQLDEIARALGRRRIPFRMRSRHALRASPAARMVLDRLTVKGIDLALAVEQLEQELEAGGDADPGCQAALAAARELLDDDPRAQGQHLASWFRTLGPGDLITAGDAVDLCTFHGAKGLEWPHVVIVGLEDGLVPIRADDPEERRLLYVAMTRSLRTLHLTWCRTRPTADAGTQPLPVPEQAPSRRPSPFLADVAAVEATATASPPERARAALAGARATLGVDPDDRGNGAFDRLLTWRHAMARAAEVTDDAVASEADLQRVATHLPADLEALERLTGWGTIRCRRLGPGLLEALGGS